MSALGDRDPMTFGKHKGTEMIDVPAKYLLYIWDSFLREKYKAGNCYPNEKKVAVYIEENLEALKLES